MALQRGSGASGTGNPLNIPDATPDGNLYGRKDNAWVEANAADTTVADAGGLLAATNVETALAELATDADNHLADTTGAHAASAIAFTPAGTVAATDVQTAINELDTEKAPLASPTFTGTPAAPTAAASTDTTQIATTAFVQDVVAAVVTGKNALINGDFAVAQRGTSFTSATTPANSDDTYLLDRWTLLSDGNDVVDVTQSTTVPTAPGALTSIALDVETVNKKFGIIQFIEQKNCNGLIGATCTLSFKMKVSATTKLDNIKAAIIAWDGTADTVTSDVVSAWNAEDTNPTLVANWTYENTPVNLVPTTSFATYSVSAAVDTASAKNIAVMIWSDVTDTTLGDFVYITDVQFEVGAAATSFERLSFDRVVEKCERYFEKTYDLATAPGTVTDAGKIRHSDPISGGQFYNQFSVRKRATPTVVLYSPATGASANYRDETSALDIAASATFVGERGFNHACGSHGAADETVAWHYTAVAEL